MAALSEFFDWIAEDVDWNWVATTVIALYAAALSSAGALRERRRDRREEQKGRHVLWLLTSETGPLSAWQEGASDSDTVLNVTVVNAGTLPVVLTNVVFKNVHAGLFGQYGHPISGRPVEGTKLLPAEEAVFGFKESELDDRWDTLVVEHTLGRYEGPRRGGHGWVWEVGTGSKPWRTERVHFDRPPEERTQGG